MKKILFALLFMTSTAYALTIDKDHPFLKVASTIDGTASVFIGAFGDIVPRKMKTGDVMLSAMMREDVGDNQHPKGEEYGYIVIASCSKQVAKTLVIWHKPKDGEKLIALFDFNSEKFSTNVFNAVDGIDVKPIDPTSMLFPVVRAGCNYIGEGKQVPSFKKKPYEVEI